MASYPLASSPYWPSQYWQWREQSIHYVQSDRRTEKTSADRPPLLLVHGFGASTDHWKKNIAELQQYYEVWAIDLLGFGRSSKPNWDYSGTLWRDQLADFVREKIGQPAILVGNSLGAYACLCAAAQVAGVAQGVVLINSAGPFTPSEPPPEPSALEKFWKTLTRQIVSHPWITRVVFWNLRRRSTVRKTLEKVYADASTVTDELVEDILRPAFDPGAFDVFSSVFRTPQGAKVDELLEELTCPLLLIWGEADPWMKVKERSQRFKEHYPNCTEFLIPAGHCPHDEAPQQVNECLDRWIRSLSLPSLLTDGQKITA
ncbi:MAG: alpha/beta fold hydrolase [Prochlorotrichaceae cyanobacterium]|jgi:pimeloyl-ACP methyl ester carboxylesterase